MIAEPTPTPASTPARLHAVERPRDTRPVSARGGVADSNEALPETLTLSRQLFLRQLELEKRRTDRTKSPLSLVVVRVDPQGGGGFPTVNAALDLLGRSKRETDILGHIAKDAVGLILPHTSAPGAQAFLHGISGATARLPIVITSGTYPDDLFDHLMCDVSHTTDALMHVTDTPALRSPVSLAAKRVLDVIGALTGLILFSPFMLATAFAVALGSPGPVVFRQTRLGKGGVPFVFYKFRSMYTDADDRMHREYVANLIEGKLDKINQGDAERPLYKIAVDPRITRVGRIIRKTSLDELPQLFNVLKGDMSLVGPRPPLPYEAEKYQSWHLRRVLEVRPGITGLWQIEGRSTTSFDDMVRLDLRYARNSSLLLDLKILLRTVLVLFGTRGAT